MPGEPQSQTDPIQLLAAINRLSVKAFNSRNQQTLSFIILNDTAQIIRYDRATLWNIEDSANDLEGVSGRASVTGTSAIARRWKTLVQSLKNPGEAQILSANSFSRNQALWEEVSKEQGGSKIIWIPIQVNEKPTLGLWLERWNNVNWQPQEIETLNFLFQGYGAAWSKYVGRYEWLKRIRDKARWIVLIALCLLFLIRVPLRIVAPAEVVAKDPILITAPLDGTISEIVVKPGQMVKKGELLFEYDKRIPLQQLQVAQKEVEIIQSEVDRAMTQGVKDEKSLAEMSILTMKLEKQKTVLKLAQYQASQLNVTTPDPGVVLLDNPDEWRGKPVKVGERVLIVSDPAQTKVRIWVPVDDNVVLDTTKPVKIFLNVNPEATYEASLTYIANYSGITEKRVAAFQAEADWIGKTPEEARMGLKGTAILYGDNVSLFYYLFRKPWGAVRSFFGV